MNITNQDPSEEMGDPAPGRTALSDQVTRGWAVVFCGTAVRLGLDFLTGVLLARTFGPSGFGVYTLLMAVTGITGALVDAGLTESAVKHIAAACGADRNLALAYARAFFWSRMGLASLAVFLGAMLTPAGASLLNLTGYEALLLLALLSMATTALSGSVSGLLQARMRFGSLSAVMITISAVGLAATAALALLDRLTLTTALWIAVSVSVIGFLAGWRLLPADWRCKGASPLRFPDRTAFRERGGTLLRFGRWLWVANIFKVLAAYLDLFLIHRFLAPGVLGVYALALNLSSKAEIINHSLYTVLIPTASALKTRADVKGYLRRSLVRSALASLVLLAIIPLAGWIIPVIYGEAYAPSVRLFNLLLGVVIFDIMTLPAVLLLYTFNRPALAALSGALQTVLFFLLGIWFIPALGPAGAVAARFGAKLCGVALTLAVLFRHFTALEDLDGSGGGPSVH